MIETRTIMYADPPYLGLAEKFYGDPTFDSIDAHAALFDFLEQKADAWAYSLHAPTLRGILAVAPPDARIGAWVKPFASFKLGVNPAYTWEPVLFKSVRSNDVNTLTVRDHVACNIVPGAGFKGTKPKLFCFWLFELLGAAPSDNFADLFPGSGAVSEAWNEWCGRPTRQEKSAGQRLLLDAT